LMYLEKKQKAGKVWKIYKNMSKTLLTLLYGRGWLNQDLLFTYSINNVNVAKITHDDWIEFVNRHDMNLFHVVDEDCDRIMRVQLTKSPITSEPKEPKAPKAPKVTKVAAAPAVLTPVQLKKAERIARKIEDVQKAARPRHQLVREILERLTILATLETIDQETLDGMVDAGIIVDTLLLLELVEVPMNLKRARSEDDDEEGEEGEPTPASRDSNTSSPKDHASDDEDAPGLPQSVLASPEKVVDIEIIDDAPKAVAPEVVTPADAPADEAPVVPMPVDDEDDIEVEPSAPKRQKGGRKAAAAPTRTLPRRSAKA